RLGHLDVHQVDRAGDSRAENVKASVENLPAKKHVFKLQMTDLTSNGAHLIEMHELTRVYQLGPQEIYALRGVDLIINRGEYVAIMGPSGSGKSTLMNIIGCLDTPSSGRYLLDGVPVETMNDDELAAIRNKKIGFV